MKTLLPAILVVLVLGATAQPNNAVTSWTYAAQNVVRQLSLNNQLAARLYALVGLAQYKALKTAIAGKTDYNPNLVIGYASHAVLVRQAPSLQGGLDNTLLAQVNNANVTALVRETSKAYGEAAAFELLEPLASDRSLELSLYRPFPAGSAPGLYQFVPGQTTVLLPSLANGSTFIFPTAAIPAFAEPYIEGPHKLGSPEYEADYAEVRDWGGLNSTRRTPYDTDTAAFWLGAVGASTGSAGLLGYLQNASISLLPSNLTLLDTAAFFAKAGASAYDTTVITWYLKYKVNKWRPTTAVRARDDPTWESLLAVAAHPEYPSAHQAVFGGGWGILLQYFNGNTSIPVSVTTEAPSVTNKTRSYPSLTAAAAEAVTSRVYAGAHFRRSTQDSYDFGLKVAKFINRNLDNVLFGKQPSYIW